jgi:YVTN family beta-propeller protein
MAIISPPCADFFRGAACALFLALALLAPGRAFAQATQDYPGMPPVPDRNNVYSETGADHVSAAAAGALARVYVPHVTSNDVYVIDPATLKVLNRVPVGRHAQHVVPSYDLKTLWVASVGARKVPGTLTPIDPTTGEPGERVLVDDPYNLYFTPDGSAAIVVAEQRRRLDFRDPHTMDLKFSVPAPQCSGINHADFSVDGRYAIFTCEFSASLVKIDLIERRVLGYLKLTGGGMPQDIRIAPKGDVFYVADMHADGVFVVDAETFTQIDLIHTGTGTHGLYPSRDGSSTSPTAAPTMCAAAATATAASRCSTSPPARWWRNGRSPAAAVPTWAMSAPTARHCGCRAGSTMKSMRSTPPTAPCRKSRSAPSRTA